VQSRDAFATIQDNILATVPANTPAGQFLPYLGDYDYLLAVGNEFRGVFFREQHARPREFSARRNVPASSGFQHAHSHRWFGQSRSDFD